MQYILISYDILQLKGFSIKEKIIYSLIKNESNITTDKRYYKGLKWLAKATTLSLATVKRTIRELALKRVLYIEYRNNQTCILQVLPLRNAYLGISENLSTNDIITLFNKCYNKLK